MKVFVYGLQVKDEEEYSYAKVLIEALIQEGIGILLYYQFANELRKYSDEFVDIATVARYEEIKKALPEATITLGGDGTILKVVTLIRDLPIPILGINLGRLGFLASVEKKIIKKAVRQFSAKEFTILERSMLELSSNKTLFTSFPYALNDFTLNRRDTSSMITIHTFVDDVLLNSYWADGIIISTPTGSTGYSLSCGGPILFPDSHNFVITPVAPHNLNVRPIVLPDNKRISIKVEGRTNSFMCTLDSRYETITSEYQIDIRKAPFNMKFVQLKGRHFMKTMNEKLLWGFDKRN
ncbi:MAG: NAD kinase [Saprospiraceae bacterium]|nr:MAG: inorganic polyphosphate/ATP-NAD kinase [Bacteroidetes bacterium OLB9]MCO6464152.1 NAD kinase [Saprospiraceae bacterium]MCZ2337612.1 NAD kinase [Chitinophagales bacterium]